MHSTVGTISLSRRGPSEDGQISYDLGPRLLINHARNPFSVSRLTSRTRTPAEMLDRIDPLTLQVDESILAFRSQIPALDAVRHALTRGRSLNISPSDAKTPDELLRRPGILPDGSGLTTTLHALQALRRGDVARTGTPFVKGDSETLDQVVEWTKLVLPFLKDIQTVQDVHTGTYIGYLSMEAEKPLRIPLQAASDGTVKWLSIVCYILTSSTFFTLEEPENFLHPKMQEFLISLIRDNIDEDRYGSILISTHSETLINYCRPDELLIFSFDNNRTECSRIRNPEKVAEQINKTGFGLGYYYASNAIS